MRDLMEYLCWEEVRIVMNLTRMNNTKEKHQKWISTFEASDKAWLGGQKDDIFYRRGNWLANVVYAEQWI